MNLGPNLPELEAVRDQKVIADVEYSYVCFKNLPEEFSQWVRTSDLDLMRKSKEFKRNSSVFLGTYKKIHKDLKSLSTRSRQSSVASNSDSAKTFKLEANRNLYSQGFGLGENYHGFQERILPRTSQGSILVGKHLMNCELDENQLMDPESVEFLKEKIFGKDQYHQLQKLKHQNLDSSKTSTAKETNRHKRTKH